MSNRYVGAYYIVPEYKRDPRRSSTAGYCTRVRYTIRHVEFPTWHRTGIFKDLDDDLSLAQAKRKLKSWKAHDKRQRK